ncbi:lactonase family protein [Marinifilum caeruleilacunae]|uniref:Lactonase family protein n=1 Tax=Marinifilum caeruleilacunae TaxID=2499076 RepID=A0ABX1WRS7_9BACT|nr:lactonase family protein [Marinifilum caeruleilacunae]NOU58639.1 lactonase family protein [Marinifilum caeruleilacunae]
MKLKHINKFAFLLAILLMAMSCNNTGKKKMEKSAYSMYIGTYTDTDSKGIYQISMNKSGKFGELKLKAETVNPSYLCFANNGKNLLAINEINTLDGVGSVESYKIGEELDLLSRKSSGGAHPCFVTTNNEGLILTANYTGGNTGFLRIDEDGMISELLDVNQHEGSGSVQGRQDAPHAHSVWFQPNSKHIIAVDLGSNELWLSKIENDQFVALERNRIAMPEGAGPRHLAFHPNGKWMYVINELNNTISSINTNNYQVVQNTSSLPKDFKGSSFTADIHISSDGKFLYGSNRGHNSIAIFEVMENGGLELIDHVSTRGDHPRNFRLSPDEKYLVVANQNTNNLISFKRNKKTGLLTFVDEAKAAKPVCVLFEN